MKVAMIAVAVMMYAYAWMDLVRHNYVIALAEGLLMFVIFLSVSHAIDLDRDDDLC